MVLERINTAVRLDGAGPLRAAGEKAIAEGILLCSADAAISRHAQIYRRRHGRGRMRLRPVQHGDNVRPGEGRLRGIQATGDAAHDAAGIGPEQRRAIPGIRRHIPEGQPAGFPLPAVIPGKEGSALRPGADTLRGEGGLAHPSGDASFHRPAHGVREPVLRRHIRKDRAAGDRRPPRKLPEKAHDLRPGAGGIRGKGGFAHAVRDALFHRPAHRLSVIRPGGDIGKSGDRHGLRAQRQRQQQNQCPSLHVPASRFRRSRDSSNRSKLCRDQSCPHTDSL